MTIVRCHCISCTRFTLSGKSDVQLVDNSSDVNEYLFSDAHAIGTRDSRASYGVDQGDYLSPCNLYSCVRHCLNDNDCGGVNYRSLGNNACACEVVEPMRVGLPLNADTDWTYYSIQ